LDVALEGVDAAAVGIGADIGRVEADRLVEIGQRAVELALFGEAVAAVAVGRSQPAAGLRLGVDHRREGRYPVIRRGRPADASLPCLVGLGRTGGGVQERQCRAEQSCGKTGRNMHIPDISMRHLAWSQVCIGGFTRLNDRLESL
jgi:hypothetical protein